MVEIISSEHSDRIHSHLGGSSAERWLSCPGSIALIEKCPKQPTSQAAQDGTEAHEFVEKATRAFLNQRETGVWECAEDFSDLVTGDNADELLPVVQQAVSVTWEKVLLNSITGKAYGLEDNFSISEELGLSGFVDFWCVYKDAKGKRVGVIYDFKYGYSYVDEKNNSQLAFYAVALRKFVQANGKDLDYVRTCIYQPRNGGGDKQTYREAKISAKRLDKWENQFLKLGTAIRNATDAKPLPVKAGDHCKYCAAKAVCPAHVKCLQKQTEMLLTADDITKSLPTVPEISDKQIFNVLANEDKICAYIDACKAYAMTRHNAGKPISGLKVIMSTPKRKWIDDEGEITVALHMLGFQPDDVFTKKLNSFTKFEKKLKREEDIVAFNKLLTRGEPKPMVALDDESNAHKEAVGTQVDMLKD